MDFDTCIQIYAMKLCRDAYDKIATDSPVIHHSRNVVRHEDLHRKRPYNTVMRRVHTRETAVLFESW